MSKWGVWVFAGVCLFLALVAESVALQWPAYATLANHLAGGLLLLPVNAGRLVALLGGGK
jgi:hypothetical protein